MGNKDNKINPNNTLKMFMGYKTMKLYTLTSLFCLWGASLRMGSHAFQCNPRALVTSSRPIGVGSKGHTASHDQGRSSCSVARPFSSLPLFLDVTAQSDDVATDDQKNEGKASSSSPPSLTTDPDRVRRRQLLLSMLAAVSTVPLVPQDATAAQDNALIETATTTLALGSVVDVIQSPLDDRNYRSIVLPGNALRILLCSDPSTNEAAVAMDVHVGAMSDPAAVPGLAHFCEHMLFLGTKKFPQENSFESFLANNGGSSNAFTDSENTVYFFNMEAESKDKFTEGLQRFGSFFEAPLFTASATGRELNAIESENKKNLQTDTFRVFQLGKARANQNHPFSKFFTGNKQTLLDDTKAKGIDLRQELINFYETYYSANQMTLAIVAPQSLDELEKMAAEAFGDIPNRNVDKPEQQWAGILPYTVDNSLVPAFGYIAEVVPVQDLRQLTVAWPIVYQSDEERNDALLYKTSQYVAHLLGHEGPRSLLSYLKSKGWANSVAAASEEDLSDFETFELVVSLTTQGFSARDQVIEAIYSYLRLLKDKTIPAYVFNEVLSLEELSWRFLIKGSPRNYATSLATTMQRYPPEYYVAGPRRLALDGYYDDPSIVVGTEPRTNFASKEQLERTMAQVQKFVSKLTVDNSIVTVLSKSFEGQTDQKEKWYGTDYRVRPISSAAMEAWKQPVAPNKLKIDFPKPNPFIPSESGLRVKIQPSRTVESAASRTFESRLTPLRPPRVIRDDGPNGRWKVYFKEDDRFGLPKAFIIFQILSNEIFETPKKAALSNLLELCIADKLGEYAYDAELAGLTYDVKVLPRGIRLTFGGYNDKLKEFAAYVSKKLSVEVASLLPKTDKEFERYKDQIMRGLSAFDVKQPYFHASYYAQLLLQPTRFQFPNSELRDQTRSLLLPDLIAYGKELWSRGKGEALIQGNFDESEALAVVKSIGDALPFKPIPESEVPPLLEALPLPPSESYIVPTRLLIAEPNPANENSVSYIMLQSLNKDEKSHMLIELIASIVQEPFYDELRTKRQLGYIVSSGVRGLANTRTLSFIVQSNVAPSAKLSVEIINFLDTVEEKLLQKISKADLAVYVKSLIDQKTEPDKDLTVEVTRNWSEISSGRFEFDRLQKEAAALLTVSKEDIVQFWRNLYSGSGRKMLIAEVIPRSGDASSEPPPSSTGYARGDQGTSGLILGVDDIVQFRRDREKTLE